MATVYSGTEGLVKVGAVTVAQIGSWDCTVERNLVKTSSFGDSWVTQKAGIGSWSGKCSGFWDIGDTGGQSALMDGLTATTPDVVAITLQISSTHNITGNVWIKSMAIKDSAEGICEVDFTFEGDSDPTIS